MALLISLLTRVSVIIPVKWGLEKIFKDLVGTLFISTYTQTVEEVQRQFLDVPYVKLTLAMNSVLFNSMQKFKT